MGTLLKLQKGVQKNVGIPLELIQKTLRHADMRTTMIYAQKAIDRSYFKKMRRF